MYILTWRRTEALYNAMWKKIIELAPNLRENLKHVHGDFEKPAMGSIAHNFPFAKYHGCLFHYCQANFKYIRGMDPPPYFVGMIYSLPLLPQGFYAEATRVLKEEAQQLGLMTYFNYFQKEWLSKSDKICLDEVEQRTNNNLESGNRYLRRKFGIHPSFYEFLGTKAVCIWSLKKCYKRI